MDKKAVETHCQTGASASNNIHNQPSVVPRAAQDGGILLSYQRIWQQGQKNAGINPGCPSAINPGGPLNINPGVPRQLFWEVFWQLFREVLWQLIDPSAVNPIARHLSLTYPP